MAFLDGDDYWYPDHLQMAFEFFRKHPGVRAYATRYAWAQEDNIPCREELSCSFVVRKLGLRGLLAIHTSSVVLESSLAASLPLWEVGKKYGEDVLYWMRLMRETDLIGLGNKTGSIYVQREGSAMHDRAYGDIPVAWSRDQEKKVYVQHLMVQEGEELWKWLENGACFYVCGDASRMAKDVDAALHEVIRTWGGKSPEEAAEYVADMKKHHRYQRDVY